MADTGTTTPDQRGPKSNGNIRVLYITKSSRTGVSPSYDLVSYLEHLSVGGSLLMAFYTTGHFIAHTSH